MLPCSPVSLKLICPVEACRKECRSYAGLMQHLHAKHIGYQRSGIPSPPSALASAVDGTPSLLVNLDSDSDLGSNLSYVSQATVIHDPGATRPGGASDSESQLELEVGSTGNHDDTSSAGNFKIPLLPSPPLDSPSRESEVPKPLPDSTEYHLFINGQLPT